MAAVTQIIPNFLGGVSKQTDQKKLPGQVRDCLNAYPDPTFGLMKRPGFKFIETIYTPTSGTDPELKDAKWFFIKRDDNEIYIGCVLDGDDSDHTTKPIRIWNKLGVECTIHYDALPWTANTAYKVGNKVTNDSSKVYQCDTAGTSAGSGGPTGTTATTNGITDNTAKWHYVSGPVAKDYLDTTHDSYDILTVQDTSIITNKTKICKPLAAPTSHVSGSHGTIRLLNIAYSNRYMVKVKIDGTLYGTNYETSIKYIGDSTDLVDADRTEGNYLDIAATSQTNSAGGATSGTGAKFNVRVNASGGTTVSIKDRGTGYAKGDKFTFTDATLGGVSAIKLLDVSSGGEDANRTAGTYPLSLANGSGVDGSTPGTGAKATIYVGTDSTRTTLATLTDGGSGFAVDETITVPAATLGGSADLVLKVKEIKAPKDLVTEVLQLNDDVTGKIAAQYYTINAEDHTPSTRETTSSDEKYLTANRILKNLKAGLEATTLPTNHIWEVTQLDSSLEVRIKNTGPNPNVYVPFELITTDSQGNFSIESFNEEVTSVANLPPQTKHDRIVKVINTGPAEAAYWSKFVAEDGVSGKGHWEETIDPTVSEGLDKSTMPHELFNSSTDNFIFRQADWTSRTVGDDVTNKHPGFIIEDSSNAGEYLRTIQQCFYHNNRLGILTDDNVVMSKSGDFFNFYYTSALTVIDSDPIDVNCSSLRPAVLHGVIPTAQGLILFSRNQQFIMFADAEVLTPASAVIRGISNYEMDPKIDPVETGTLINFVSKTPSSTRVFSVQTRGADESPNVLDIGKIVSGWIPETTKNLLSSPVNSLLALYGDNSTTGVVGSPTMYIYKTYVVGDKMAMQAWVKWDLPGNIQHISIDNDVMYAVVETTQFLDDDSTDKGKYILCSTNLTEAPEETIITTADGQKVNPYMDLYSKAQNGTDKDADGYKTVVYDTAGDFSKCYIPYADLTELNPVILIAGDATYNFAGINNSGFTINPTRGTDTDGTYFKVPGMNLEGQDDKVYVGYQYNYDVELPKTYFKLNPEGTQYDYTAALTVARMKFALGLSSVCSFKVKSKGYRGELAEFTGDGTTNAFSVPFLLKEENGIKVTLNGTRQDPDVYTVSRTVSGGVTISNSDTVTFDTPPLGHTVKQYNPGTGYPTVGTDVATTGGSGTGLTVDYFVDGYAQATADQTGTAITDNAISSSSPYSGQSDRDEQIYNYCWTGWNANKANQTGQYAALDVDGDGVVSPSDAAILLKYFIGPAYDGAALTNGHTFGSNATRTTHTAIRAFIADHVANTLIDRGSYNGSYIGTKNVYDLDASGGSITVLGDILMLIRIFGFFDSNSGAVIGTTGFLNPHDGGPATWDGSNWVSGTPEVSVRTQGTGYKPNDVITITGGNGDATFLFDRVGDKIEITTDTWYDVQPSSDAGQYLADDVPLVEENIFTIPLHQRSENFNMRVFSNSPFPVSLTSMMWEGQYSPRFYRRT